LATPAVDGFYRDDGKRSSSEGWYYNTCMKSMRLLLTLIGLSLLVIQPVHASTGAAAGGEPPLVLVLTIDGAIAPAVHDYLSRGIDVAEQRDAEVLIVQLNTPGGYIKTMNDMVQEIRASRVPVVVYVAPRGAMAGSAGTMVTLAGHASAMAPETIIGAASPVGGQGEDLGETLKAKEMEALKATVRTLAERRGADAIALAEATIESAKAVSATEALQVGLVDFIATDLDDLLGQLDGFTIQLADESRTLHTAGAATESLAMTLLEQLLEILTSPNVVFVLQSIGVLAIIVEFVTPGGWVTGFIGVVCLALAAYGMSVLSVNWFGLVFLVIAFVLFIVDIKAPTHGGLTVAGIGSLVVSALVLFNSPGTPRFQQVSLPLVILVSILIGLLFVVIISFALRAQKRPVVSGAEGMRGAIGVARTDIDVSGQVQAGGELWTAELAEGQERIQKGERVEIDEVEGLRLRVRKIK